MIPAFVTRPNSDPPYPLVVMPHAAVFIQETVFYDGQAQMLANYGYMVLQPQYRGSPGFGDDFYLSAFEGGGQGGYKMQDDKDDGALYLVETGLVTSDRIAMYGWSYGGYAALIAASRTPQVYQCVIAAAPITDAGAQVEYYRDALRGHSRDQQLALWIDSISPIEEVEMVNVPVMLVHGSVDQRAPPSRARQYLQMLSKIGKDRHLIRLEGVVRSYETLSFDNRIELNAAIIGYLENDCGPGGL